MNDSFHAERHSGCRISTQFCAFFQTADGRRIPTWGRLNVAFGWPSATSSVIELTAFSVRFFDFQHKLLGAGLSNPFSSSTLCFSRHRESCRLDHDPVAARIQGRVFGLVSIASPAATQPDSEYDNGIAAATFAAEARVEVFLGKGVTATPVGATSSDSAARVRISIHSPGPVPTGIGAGAGAPSTTFEVEIDAQALMRVHGRALLATKEFAVQPVFIRSAGARTTGRSFAFGRPGLVSIWSRIGVFFDFRPAIFVDAPLHVIMRARVRDTTGRLVDNLNGEPAASGDRLENGVYALGRTVDADDAIRIFFVERLIDVADDERPAWGGGKTFFGGTPNSFVITSDENANGVEFHHLAHEVGHALGFRHPGSAATETQVAAVSGTVMCPSGFLEDNPDVNSSRHYEQVADYFDSDSRLFHRQPDCDVQCGQCRGGGPE